MQSTMSKKLFQVLTIGIFCIAIEGAQNPSRADLLQCKALMAKCLNDEKQYPGWHAGCGSYPDNFAVKSCRTEEAKGGDIHARCLAGCNFFASHSKCDKNSPCE